MSKTYTNKGNCIRAARAALGKTAKVDVDFSIHGSDKAFTFTALKAAKKAKRPAGERSPVSNQPKVIMLIKYIGSAQKGRTVEECMSHTKVGSPHTIRGQVSRANAEGAGITVAREGRTVRYVISA